MRYLSCLILSLFLFTFYVGNAASQDLDAGAKIYKKVCKACHGPTAKGMASFPKLVGQTSEYLTEKLVAYKSGEKVGPNTPLMAPRAAKLSDEDISNISHYIAETFN